MEREALIRAMQDAARNYLEPTTYQRRSSGGTCRFDSEADMPSRFQSMEGRAAMDRRRDAMFIADIIYFLDSAEWGTNVLAEA